MAAFDQHANYDCPPSSEEGSHSDSSVITISPDETETQELDMNVSTVRQAPWDDETPGPSYSSSEQVHIGVSSLLNSSDSSDEELVPTGATSQVQGVQTNDDLNNDSDSSSDNCVIVGFVKPLAERTPELVELSSDSEELGSYEKMETVKTQEQEQSYISDDSDVCQCSSPRSGLGKDEQPLIRQRDKTQEEEKEDTQPECRDKFMKEKLWTQLNTIRRKKKKHKKKHKKRHGDTTSRSPVVITIDSDSDKDPEVKAAVECSDGNLPQPLHSEIFTPSLDSFETRDVVTIEDELSVLDKECDVTAFTDDLSTSQTLDNSVPPAVSVEQILDNRRDLGSRWSRLRSVNSCSMPSLQVLYQPKSVMHLLILCLILETAHGRIIW
ncbi:E3 ubiquitin-protein ligase Topors [Lemmus lemmus]